MSKDNYSHAAHTLKVLKGSKARCGGRAVLSVMCMRAEFKKPEVTITKAQITSLTGLERKAVQRALAFLRDEGSIVPVAHFEGGSGHAVTYRLEALGQGSDDAPKADRAGRVRSMRQRLMADDSRLTFGEAQALAEKTA